MIWGHLPFSLECCFLSKFTHSHSLSMLLTQKVDLHLRLLCRASHRNIFLLTDFPWIFQRQLKRNIIWNEILDSHICSPSKGICLSNSFFCVVTCTTIYPLAEVRNLGFTPCYSFSVTSHVQSLSICLRFVHGSHLHWHHSRSGHRSLLLESPQYILFFLLLLFPGYS